MSKDSHMHLSRRERQIMDIVYQERRVTAGEVLQRLPDPPSYSAVRAMLRVLENGDKVKMVLSDYETYSVDTLDDLKRVESVMTNDALIKKYVKQ